MRPALLLLLALAGCVEALPITLGVDLASVTVLGRGVGDIAVSAITGRDCSIVRLDKGQTYCAREPSFREAYCTRTLARVDCWAAPPPFGTLVADTPPPTPAQQRYQLARWPKAINAEP